MFSIGQKVRWNDDAWQNPGLSGGSKKRDYIDAALVPLMGRGPHKIIKVNDQENGRQDIFLDVEGYKHVPCNSLSLELAE